MINSSLANPINYGTKGAGVLQQLHASTSRALSAARSGGGETFRLEGRPSASAPEMPEVRMKSIRETRFYQRDVQEHFLLSSDALMKSIAYTKAQAKSAIQHIPEKVEVKKRQFSQQNRAAEASGEPSGRATAKGDNGRKRMGDITVQEAKSSWSVGEKVDTYV